MSWSTVWSAVEREGRRRVEDPDRVGPAAMIGFGETVMQPAHRRRRRRFITAVVDGTGWARLHAAVAAADPDDALSGAWAGKEEGS